MKSSGKLLVVDSNPVQLQELVEILAEENIIILSASNWEDAMMLVNAESITGIVLGPGTEENDCMQLAATLEASNHNKTPVYYLTDKEPQASNPLAQASAVSQYVISRKADLHRLKEIISTAHTAYTKQHDFKEAGQLLDDVIESLEVYTHEIHDSIRYASHIQKALLPSEDSLDRIMRDYFVINKAKDVLSGDFYWFTIKYNRLIIAVADCTGHGVPGALLSMIGSTLLNSIVNEKNITNPSQILKQMNQHLQGAFENSTETCEMKDGMDMSVISIDPDKRSIEFSGAHRPLIGFVNGELLKIKGDLNPIGACTPISADYTLHCIKYGMKDVFYLKSDGYCDQFGGDHDKKLGSRKFQEILEGMQHLTMTEQKSYLNLYHNNWRKKLVQTDDILVMGFRPASIY